MPIKPQPCAKHIFILTRPEHQVKNLATELVNLGGQCRLLPTLAIKPLSAQQISQAIASLPNKLDKVIFTSANAVYPLMPYWQRIKTTAVFAVGSGTAKALANWAISAKVPENAQFTSAGLLALAELQAVQNQQIVIFSGVGGRMQLASELSRRGATVEKVAVYQREEPMVLASAFSSPEEISLIISTSEESLKNLWRLAGIKGQAWLSDQRLLVISQNMQLLAMQLGFNHSPVLAQNASDEAILAAIVAYCNPTP